jgi:lactate dehydrogenase-like 2-hydroxyacid dehydrogenase
MFDVLMPAPIMPLIEEGLAARLPLHKLWTMDDPEAGLAALAGEIRGIAAGGGHQPIDQAFMARFPRLEIVASFGVGYDHVDANWAGRHGIVVTNTPDVLSDEVADTALGLLLCTVRRLPQADQHVRLGKWPGGDFPLSPTLRRRTMGIVGLGRIGRAIARRAEAFGLQIAYHGRQPQPGSPYLSYPRWIDMAAAVDILMVIVPGGAATRGLISAEILEALGPNGILINVARGSVVDETALIAALQAGKILAAGLDVYAAEPHVPPALIAMDNVVLLPHVGSASVDARQAMGQLVVDNLVHWSQGKGPLTPVAETPWPRPDKSAK